MMGKKAADLHNQIALLNFNKFQFNEINNALNRFSTKVFAQWNDYSDNQSQKKQEKKYQPSLGSGVKTVWRTLQSSNKNDDLNTVSGWSRHQTTHQALTCSVTAQQRKNNVTNTILWHCCADFEQANAWVDQNIMTDKTRHRTTNQSFTRSKIPQQREKNVANIISLTLWSWLWAGKVLLSYKQLALL